MDKELMESIREILKEELEPIKTEIKGLKKGQSSLKEQVQDLKTGPFFLIISLGIYFGLDFIMNLF